jgi:hypothetical protein
MSKRAFNKIKRGLDEARAFLDGTADKTRFRVHVGDQRNAQDEMCSGADSILAKGNHPNSRSTSSPGMRDGWKIGRK